MRGGQTRRVNKVESEREITYEETERAAGAIRKKREMEEILRLGKRERKRMSE